MDTVLEQIDAMINHIFNMPITNDTDALLAGLQDLRNTFTGCQCRRVERENGTVAIYVNPWCVEHGIETQKVQP